MPADLNRVTLVGRLTRDPELRVTAGGTSVASLRLAVTSRVNRGGEWQDVPNYFDVTVFGRRAETVETYCGKGTRIGIDGRLSWREWEAKDGSRRQAVEVIADSAYFLDSSREEGGSGGGSRGGATRRGGDNDLPADMSDYPPADDDGIPF